MTEQKSMPTVYDPSSVESKWYKDWIDNNYFHAEVEKDKQAFSIVMPPPNVTGSLHLGHAMDNTMQDILTRWRRMQGYNTLWVPGTDHAGIATQAKVEEQLAKEGTNKHELGRENFLARVWDWKEQYGNRITDQLKRLGASCDWSRERFTMDEGCSEAVREVFIRLYEKGLIYRGNRIINWCPKCHTTISDIEVEHQEKEGNLYHLRYPLKDGSGYIEVATTRPETMLGDTGVAVHPEDERYINLIGKTLVLPIVGREIPIFADEHVEKDFGTGAVKVTPSHDPNDFDMGLRHNLEQIEVLTKDAKMNEFAGKYQGMDRYECRKLIVADLEAAGALIKIEAHVHNVGECYRCSTVVEPMVSKQWFVKMQPLAEPAIQASKDGRVEFVPERFTKIYLGWMENIRDWCISRQLWWGHRIPVWYCQDCGAELCATDEPKTCTKCGSAKLEQDPDVLDTWFSSGLWPFSTMGWPRQTPELEQFYPTSVLVTGRDIIFFWVARMIFTALEFTEQSPFKHVFIHGLILDSQGRKMSKSLGNGVDPIEVIDQYGADTLRFMLITGNTPGNDVRFQFDRLDATRNFANKIWNASRFVLMNLEDYTPHQQLAEGSDQERLQFILESPELELNMVDRWILTRFTATVQEVNKALENFDLGQAGSLIYEFIWNEFCDWYIELAKGRLYAKDNHRARYTAQVVLHAVLKGTMELLHPFMPFITEEIYQHLPGTKGTVMLARFPRGIELGEEFAAAEQNMGLIMEVIKGIRNIRAEMNVPLGKKAEVILVANSPSTLSVIEEGQQFIKQLASASELTIHLQLAEKPEQAGTAIVGMVEVYVPLAGAIDLDKEITRLEKELDSMQKEIQRAESKLNNQGFVAKAPVEVIDKEREKLVGFIAKRQALEERIEGLKK
jgi:valyl-tRNA synthetase